MTKTAYEGKTGNGQEGLCSLQACKYLYWDEGHRSFGDNIPGYAQGAYFPGDEPGWKCSLTFEPCPVESAQDEEDCACGRLK